MPVNIQQLHEARAASDRRWMQHKARMLGYFMRQDPGEWLVDSAARSPFPGITHVPSGYRFHVPRSIIPQMLQDIDNPEQTARLVP